MVDLICDKLNSNGLLYKRDVKDCTLQDSITGFEEEIGRGDYIIVVLSDDYFESLGCMYEMACITENGKIGERAGSRSNKQAQNYQAGSLLLLAPDREIINPTIKHKPSTQHITEYRGLELFY